VLLTADAFRADALGSRSGERSRTPHLDALARQSIAFKEAIADYSHTSRSLLSILSGRWNINLAREKSLNRNQQDLDNRTRLPRILRQNGYFALASMPGGRRWQRFFDANHIAGFDQHVQPGTTCIQQAEHFEQFVQHYDGQKPFFAWIHMFDSHTPLQHPEVNDSFVGQPALEYAAAIEHVDRCAGSMIASLQKKQIWDSTIFVFMADHGEALGEHQRTLKHSTCYLHDIRIPMLLKLPGFHSPRQIGYRIQPSDLLPTLANLLGVRLDAEIVEGDDLSGMLDQELPSEDRGMAFSGGLSDQYPCVGVLRDSWHLIYTPVGQFYELYDIHADPTESNNLVATNAPVVEELRKLLDPYYAHYRVQELSESILE
jgi:arylsulfatase A-like enzyme